MPKGPDYESYGNIALAHAIANLLEAAKLSSLSPNQHEDLSRAYEELSDRVQPLLDDSDGPDV